MKEQSQGLVCPNCAGVVPVPEGVRIVHCPFCQMYSLVQGERGVRRWQVNREVEREQVLQIVQRFFSGMQKAGDLRQKAEVRDIFLVYLPYWRVQATVAGWLFGRVKSGKDSTSPVEMDVLEEMHWNDAAVDVSEFGVHRVVLSKEDLQPYDEDLLHSEAMVFDPTESHSDALEEARQHFTFRGRQMRSMQQKFFEKFHFLREQLSIVYYPLWVVRYSYRQRSYQVVVDGRQGQILYGKAPGNILYRAAALVVGMALGNLLLVDGTAVAGWLASGSDDGDALGIVLVPIALGIGLIAMGYRAFRHGEEVEEIAPEHKKARLADTGSGSLADLPEAMKSGDISRLLETGLSFIEEMAEMKKK